MPLCVGSGSQPKDGAVRCMRRLQIAQQCRVLALSLQVSEGEVFAGSLGVVCLLLMLFNFGGGTESHVTQLTSNLTHIPAMS